MKKIFVASLVLLAGIGLAACSQTSKTVNTPTTGTTAQTGTQPISTPMMEKETTVGMTADQEIDQKNPATTSDSVDDLDKEISNYTVEQEQFN